MQTYRILAFTALLVAGCSGLDASDELIASAEHELNPPAAVLGFENVSYWTATQGNKTSSVTRTQGNASLGLSGFTYSELTSSPFATVTGATSTIAFDFRAPSSPAWGQATLFVNIPSRSIHNASLGAVSLAGSAANTFRSVSFSVPSNVLTALRQSYSDLTFKIGLNLPQLSQPYLIDNLRFIGATQESVVRLSVSGVDDFVYVTVNGVRRKSVGIPQSLSGQDVSSWFSAGANTVRIQGINTDGPASYNVQLTVDGQVVIDANCANAPCNPNTPAGLGIVFDQTYQVSTPNRPTPATLTVNGTSGGKIYLNDAYTGKTVPASFTLPRGPYIVGVGVGVGTHGAYQGAYYEQTVQLGGTALTVTPTQTAPLATPNRTKVAILPIRNTIHGTDVASNRGVLSNNDITIMHGQTLATRDQYVKPFSYGLTTWDVTVLPTVENTPLYRGAAPGDSPDTWRFLVDSNLTSLEQTYDSIIYYFSKYTATGQVVANDPCCWWGTGQMVAFPNHGMRDGASPNQPNVYLLHEMLHDYEAYNHGRLSFYNGAGGLHGANYHGYYGGDNGEPDFLQYYRLFMRNQVAEINTMRNGVPASVPQTADLWVGVFDTMRRDVSWNAPAAGAQTFAVRSSTPAPVAQGRSASMCALPAH